MKGVKSLKNGFSALQAFMPFSQFFSSVFDLIATKRLISSET